jgi:hypothetical protein
MTSKQTGTVNDTNGLLRKADDSNHFFETRLVERTPATQMERSIIPPGFKRTRLRVAMEEDGKWPSYTFTISALNFVNQITTHYTMNMGLRNKAVIDLVKSKTILNYKVMSDQPWQCRMIVWASGDAGPYNRGLGGHTQLQTTAGFEYELLNHMGTMSKTSHNTCKIDWEETSYTSPQDTMANNIPKRINNLLAGPLNTKYPSTPFYWQVSEGVTKIFECIETIPGKESHLKSQMFKMDTWQKGPGMVEYKDDIGRGGKVTSIGNDIKFQKNWHVTFIWQPEGDFSGSPLPVSKDDPFNWLEVDIIHTLFWNQ